jgi:hypothetical protein
VVVNGNVVTTIDLQSSAPTNGALLSWSFAAATGSYSPPCTASTDTDPDRMDSVALYVDGANNSPAATYDCTQGFGGAQVSTPTLAPGNHTLQLVAYQAGVSYGFAESAPVPVNIVAGAPTSQAFTLAWLVGGTGVAWTYPAAGVCASSVNSVTATFSGPASTGYTLAGWPCGTPVAPFKRLPATAGGVTYSLTVSALGPPPQSSVVYSGTASAVSIQPGQFYDGTSATVVTVPLN